MRMFFLNDTMTECYSPFLAATSRRQDIGGISMAKFRGATLTCQECGAAFKVPPSRAATARYCSKECADQHRGESRIRRITLTCANCGEPFETFPSHFNRRKYCSSKCKHTSEAFLRAKSEQAAGDLNPNWRGGRSLRHDGYVYARAADHPYAGPNGYVLEHRLVMEAWLRENDPSSAFLITLGMQRYLAPALVVHHRDGDRTNNAIENLECMTGDQHKRHHETERRTAKAKRGSPK